MFLVECPGGLRTREVLEKSLRSTWRRVQRSIRIVGQRIITWRILVIIFVVNFKGYGVELTVEGVGGGILFENYF